MPGSFNRRSVRALRSAVEAVEQRTLLSASFFTPNDVSVGNFPTDIVVADLNGDGRPDVATANSADLSVTVRYGNANGTFSSIVIHPLGFGGFGPELLVAGDLDGDSDLDLVALDEGGNYVTFRNTPASNGFRNFTPLGVVSSNTLSAREAELIDMNGDALLDLVVYGDAVAGVVGLGARIYTGAGNLTFSPTPTVTPLNGSGPNGFVVTDLDGNGAPDYAALSTDIADNHRITVVLNPLAGATTTTGQLAAAPQDLAFGDFNGDGKPDLVATVDRSGTQGIVRVVSYYQNDGNGGFPTGVTVFNAEVFTRQIAAVDIDGDSNLDIVLLSGDQSGSLEDDQIVVVQGKGDGTFATTASTVATNAFPVAFGFADFNGDSKTDAAVASLTEANFAVHLNNSTPGLPEGGGPNPDPEPTNSDLAASFGAIALPDVFVPGDKGSAQVVIANTGATAKGKVNVALYASTDATLDGADALLDTGTSLANKSVNIRDGKTAKLTGKFVAPATLANGTYFLIAKVTPVDITGAAETTAASTATYEAVTRFGQVGARKNVKYAYTDADGTLVTYALSGPGTGVVSTSGSDVTLTLSDTTARSKFTATTKGGADAETSIANLTVNGPVAGVAGKGLSVTNSIAIGDVKTIVLADVTGSASDVAVTLTGTTPVSVTLGDVRDAILTSAVGIKALKLNAWTDAGFANDVITAPWIGSLTVAGGFAPDLALAGAGAPKGTTIGSAKIGADVATSVWAATGNIGALTISGSVADGWVGNFTGTLKGVTVKGSYLGDLAVGGTISGFAVTGDVTNASVRAGTTFGADNAVATGDDTFAGAEIKKVAVKGAVTGSAFLAGADSNGAAIAGGKLGSVTIGGPADATTSFVAAILPRTAKIGGATIITANDPRFGGQPA